MSVVSGGSGLEFGGWLPNDLMEPLVVPGTVKGKTEEVVWSGEISGYKGIDYF